jgi:chromosomal replication initiator protein
MPRREPRGRVAEEEKGRAGRAVTEAEDLWTKCSDSLRDQVSESTWQLWLSGIEPISFDDGVFVLSVPNGLIRERVESRYLPMIEDTLANEVGAPVRGRLDVLDRGAAIRSDLPFDDVLGHPDERNPGSGDLGSLGGGSGHGRSGHPAISDLGGDADPGHFDPEGAVGGIGAGVEFGRPGERAETGAGSIHDLSNAAANSQIPGRRRSSRDSGPSGQPGGSRSSRESRDGREGPAVQLDAKFTFENFVTASSNRLAHAAAQAVAETPGRSYNPLFIYGDSGLGKTHLLHAIGNYVSENYVRRKVLYVTTETFMNDFVDSLRTSTTLAFKRRYRDCDVLLIDDVQFMERKEGLQEEFFHTYNDLKGASKQIVLTSDRPPKSIETLEDRLRSRFLSGLITEIDPPDLETRLAILRSKCMSEHQDVPDDVLEFIASHVKDNIRELEGALIRICAFAKLNHEPISLGQAEDVLSDLVLAGEPRRISPQFILETTAASYGFSVEAICGPSRTRPLVTARQVAMYLTRELTDYSYPAIGRVFGKRDHTTVIHAVDKIAGQMQERRQIYEQVTELIQKIRAGSS